MIELPELIGRTIVMANREPLDDRYGLGGGELYLTLDDGTKVEVARWGHDSWGTDVVIFKP